MAVSFIAFFNGVKNCCQVLGGNQLWGFKKTKPFKLQTPRGCFLNESGKMLYLEPVCPLFW